jgi:hypothetical protein
MVLDSIGAGLIDQDALFQINQENSRIESGWLSGPDGIAFTMEDLKPAGSDKTFALVALSSADALARKICWAIHHHEVAPIVLVYGNAHWIVVTGFSASAMPTSADDTTYTIASFDLHNPVPPAPGDGNPPPHHNDGDGCGTGDLRGTPHELVPYEPIAGVANNNFWRVDYMTPVPSGFWRGQFLAICDPDAAADTQDPPLIPDGELVTDTAVIVERARQGLATQDVRNPGAWSAWPRGDAVEETFRVERLDLDPPRFYDIVAFRLPSGEVPIAVNVNPYETGGFAGCIAAPVEGTTHFTRALSRESVIERFAGQQIEVDGSTVTLQQEHLLDHLVWRPCAESLSLYWPFYRFDEAGAKGPVSVHVRIDGELFTELHVGKGM